MMIRASIFLVALLGAPILAHAQQSPELTPEQKRAKAVELYQEADALYQVQEFEKALVLFKEAYLLSVEPDLLYNIGQCQRQLNKDEEALKSYKAYLRNAQDIDPKIRSDVEGFIKELDEKVKKAKAATQPTDKPKRPPLDVDPKIPELLYKGAAAAGGVGVLTGAVSLLSARSAQKLSTDPDAEANVLSRRAGLSVVSGVTSDVTLFLALGGGGAAYFLNRGINQEEYLHPPILFGAAGASAALGLSAGLIARSVVNNTEEAQAAGEGSPEEFAQKLSFAKKMSVSADVLVGLGIISGGLGVYSLTTQNSTAALSLQPNGIAVSLKF